MSSPASKTVSRRNRRTVLLLATLFAGMVGLTAASVPLYRLFCQVTGFGGTTQVGAEAPGAVGGETVTVRFNADTNRQLGWSFQPVERSVVVPVGEPALVYFRAQNLTARDTIGTATFNVTPLDAGQYFVKIECFCFTEQSLAPGQTVEMPVQFYVDPAILDDVDLDQMRTITLSYTFFPLAEKEPVLEISDAESASGAATGGIN